MNKLCPFKVNSLELKQGSHETETKTSFGRCEEEGCHSEADSILTDFLNKIGFNDIVVEYNKVEKWYA